MDRKKDYIKLCIPNNFYTDKKIYIKWKNNIGKHITIQYNNNEYDVVVKNVDSEKQSVILHRSGKEISISFVSILNKLKEQKRDGMCNAGKLLALVDDSVMQSSDGWNAILHFKYNIGDHIVSEKSDFIITGKYIVKDKNGKNRKFYNIHCNMCGWDGFTSESTIIKNPSCMCCNKNIVVIGINDIATTDPWAIEYFVNIEDTHKYHNSSNAMVNMRCPFCGELYYNVNIRGFFTNVHHLNCPCKTTYASYPERFVFNVLKMLNINNIITQATKKNEGWIDNYRYDFYIPNASCIIEVHGPQHYYDCFQKIGGKSYEEEVLNDKMKKKLAMENNIQHYIIINAEKSNKKWIKHSILKSQLVEIFNFKESDIDWDLCNFKAQSELIKDVCKSYMTNLNYTKDILANQYGVKKDTIRRYLIKGREFGLCDYNPYSFREKFAEGLISSIIVVYKDKSLIGAYSSLEDLHSKSIDLFGYSVSAHKISYTIDNQVCIDGYSIVRNAFVRTYNQYIDFMLNAIN